MWCVLSSYFSVMLIRVGLSCTGFVNMDRLEDAVRAKKQLNGKEIFGFEAGSVKSMSTWIAVLSMLIVFQSVLPKFQLDQKMPLPPHLARMPIWLAISLISETTMDRQCLQLVKHCKQRSARLKCIKMAGSSIEKLHLLLHLSYSKCFETCVEPMILISSRIFGSSMVGSYHTSRTVLTPYDSYGHSLYAILHFYPTRSN